MWCGIVQLIGYQYGPAGLFDQHATHDRARLEIPELTRRIIVQSGQNSIHIVPKVFAQCRPPNRSAFFQEGNVDFSGHVLSNSN